MNQDLDPIERVAAILAQVPEKIVFTGGATISLYLDKASAADIRPTFD